MAKLFFAILTSLIFCLSTNGQTDNDSTIVKKYLADTLNFNSFPNAKLLDSIKPSKGFKKWEINTATSLTGFKNFDRYPKSKKNISDTVVLSKCLRGFATFCPPSGCAWYISAQKGKKIITVEELNGLSNFLGAIDNKFDAFLWLISHDLSDSRFVPIGTSSNLKYKIVDSGYLIGITMRISDCPVTSAFVIYFVGFDKKVIRINTKVLEVGEGCI